MLRIKSHRLSEAARRRAKLFWTRNIFSFSYILFLIVHGTGRRQVNEWDDGTVTQHKHKLVIPKRSVDKKFVLIGAWHLSQEPDAVCVLAPSNNLTASRTPEEAGQAFEKYLLAVLSQWSKVSFFCTSMVPLLTEPREKQEFYDQEFHRRAKRVSFTSIAEHFPWSCTDLWCHDSVHLSDSEGMPRLAELIKLQSQVSRPYIPRFVPRKGVKGLEHLYDTISTRSERRRPWLIGPRTAPGLHFSRSALRKPFSLKLFQLKVSFGSSALAAARSYPPTPLLIHAMLQRLPALPRPVPPSQNICVSAISG
uniref:Uncharacterized protein n=1 Tax=Cyprinodon variegatus TaxID=28743 RepID=A0A3Q2CN94_CYPVA